MLWDLLSICLLGILVCAPGVISSGQSCHMETGYIIQDLNMVRIVHTVSKMVIMTERGYGVLGMMVKFRSGKLKMCVVFGSMGYAVTGESTVPPCGRIV